MDEASVYELLVWQEAVRNLSPDERAKLDAALKGLLIDLSDQEALRLITAQIKETK